MSASAAVIDNIPRPPTDAIGTPNFLLRTPTVAKGLRDILTVSVGFFAVPSSLL